MKLSCSPGADAGDTRPFGRVNEETMNATNELDNEETMSKNEYEAEKMKSKTGRHDGIEKSHRTQGVAALRQHYRCKRAKMAASKLGRRSASLGASSATQCAEDEYEGESENEVDGVKVPYPVNETVKSEPNRNVLQEI